MLPLLLVGASLITGAMGIKKGYDAKKLYEEAKNIGSSAERRHRRAVKDLEEKREQTHANLVALGEEKARIFSSTGQYIVDQVRNARSNIQQVEFEKSALAETELAIFESDIAKMAPLNVASDSAKSMALAAIGASGIYTTVSMTAAASTGTAIASLSGAAATNATMAWLGGGSLAAGGLGVAGGAWVLAGTVAGPALAITGFTLASKAEAAVTEAEEFAAEVKLKIAELEPIHFMLDSICQNINETKGALESLEAAFSHATQEYQRLLKKSESLWQKILKKFSEKRRTQEAADIEAGLTRLVAIFKAIKEVVQAPILDEEQLPVTGLTTRLSHVLEVANVPAITAPEGEKA